MPPEPALLQTTKELTVVSVKLGTVYSVVTVVAEGADWPNTLITSVTMPPSKEIEIDAQPKTQSYRPAFWQALCHFPMFET